MSEAQRSRVKSNSKLTALYNFTHLAEKKNMLHQQNWHWIAIQQGKITIKYDNTLQFIQVYEKTIDV